MTREEAFDAADRRAGMARARFLGSVSEAKARFAPDRLRHDAREKAGEMLAATGDKARAAARRHPLAISGTLAVIFGWIFRRPIKALFCWSFVKIRDSRRARGATEGET